MEEEEGWEVQAVWPSGPEGARMVSASDKCRNLGKVLLHPCLASLKARNIPSRDGFCPDLNPRSTSTGCVNLGRHPHFSAPLLYTVRMKAGPVCSEGAGEKAHPGPSFSVGHGGGLCRDGLRLSPVWRFFQKRGGLGLYPLFLPDEAYTSWPFLPKRWGSRAPRQSVYPHSLQS